MTRAVIAVGVLSAIFGVSWTSAPPKENFRSASSPYDIISRVRPNPFEVDLKFCDVLYGSVENAVDETYVVLGSDEMVYKTLEYEDTYKLAPFLACDHGWLLQPYVRLARDVITSMGKVDMDAIHTVLSGNATMYGIKKFIMQQTGVFVLTSVGLLTALLTPFIACCFCCCRCRGRCGGRFTMAIAQKQKKKHCAAIAVFFIITFAFLLAGSGSLYTVGLRMLQTKTQLTHVANFIVDDVLLYRDEIFNHLDQVASTDLSSTVDYIDEVMNNSGDRMCRYFDQFGDPKKNTLEAALDSLLQTISSIESRLAFITASTANIQSTYTTLNTELGALSTEVQNKYDSCSPSISDCTQLPQSSDLETIYDFSLFSPDLTNQNTFLGDLQTFNITGIKSQILAAYNDIPVRLGNSGVTVTSNVNASLRLITETIGPQLAHMRSTINNATESVYSLKDVINTLSNSTEEYIEYGDFTLMGLSGLVLFVLLISACALLHALCGIRHIFTPEKRNVFIHCGRNCLMMGVAFSFVFVVLYFLLGSILFFLGAQLTMICEPIKDHSILQFVDDPEMWNGEYMLGEAILGNGSIELTATKIIDECQANRAVYSTLMLAHVFDVTTFVDIEAQMPNMSDLYSLIQTEFATTDVIPDATYAGLVTLNGTNAVPLDVTTMMAGVLGGAATLGEKLNTSRQTIYNAAIYVSAYDATFESVYVAQVNKLKSLEDVEGMEIVNNVTLVNNTLLGLQTDLQAALDSIQAIHDGAGEVETFIQTQGPAYIVQGVDQFIQDVINIADHYVNHLGQRLKNDVGRCHVVYDIYNGISYTLCSHFLDSFNGLWLSVCVIAFFLIPHIIVSVKLARYFRRPDDVSSYRQSQRGPRALAVELKGVTAKEDRV